MFHTIALQRSEFPNLVATLTANNPKILFIHGCTETAELWFALMKALADIGINSAAIDLRGHGKSDGHDSIQSFGIIDYVEDAKAILNQLSSIKIVVGHSMGGLVTQKLASELALDHIVLIASSPVTGMKEDVIRMVRKHPWTFFMSYLRRSFKRLYLSEHVTKSLLFHSKTPDSVVRKTMSMLQEDSWKAGNELKTILPDPHSIRCPVTVIGGQLDFMVSHKSMEATALAYKTKAIYLENCAHMVPIEAEPMFLARLLKKCIGL
jgi:pimeloyl-ACP methyl ester carboxylesterase